MIYLNPEQCINGIDVFDSVQHIYEDYFEKLAIIEAMDIEQFNTGSQNLSESELTRVYIKDNPLIYTEANSYDGKFVVANTHYTNLLDTLHFIIDGVRTDYDKVFNAIQHNIEVSRANLKLNLFDKTKQFLDGLDLFVVKDLGAIKNTEIQNVSSRFNNAPIPFIEFKDTRFSQFERIKSVFVTREEANDLILRLNSKEEVALYDSIHSKI